MRLLTMAAGAFLLLALVGAVARGEAYRRGYRDNRSHWFGMGSDNWYYDLIDDRLTSDNPSPQRYMLRQFALVLLVFTVGLAVVACLWWSKRGLFGG